MNRFLSSPAIPVGKRLTPLSGPLVLYNGPYAAILFVISYTLLFQILIRIWRINKRIKSILADFGKEKEHPALSTRCSAVTARSGRFCYLPLLFFFGFSVPVLFRHLSSKLFLWYDLERDKSVVVVKEIHNVFLDFYVDYGFASSIYDDWFWKIFYEKGSKGNKFSIWISDFNVYEE